MNRKYRQFPPLVMDWLQLYGAWLVGSAAKWYVDGDDQSEPPKNFDVAIPPARFMDACKPLRYEELSSTMKFRFTSFGGISVSSGDVSVDFWPMSLEDFLAMSNKNGPQVAVRLRPQTIVRWDRCE